MWNLDPPPGFQGLHPDKKVEFYCRHLPHWRQEGATYFVTFRLGDSLPQSKLRELEAWRDQWLRKHPEPRTEECWDEMSREAMRQIEQWLDQGMGCCILRHANAHQLVVESLLHFDGVRYELDAYVVMPNHVHLLVRPFDASVWPLESILKSWKQFTSKRIRERFGESAPHWQDESFDRIVRDAEQLYRCLRYIGANPEKAGLTVEVCPTWVRPEWEQLGWRLWDPK